MPRPLRRQLRDRLEELRVRYERPEALESDPLALVLRYPPGADRELAAFLAASLAYGRVAPMLRAIEGALAPLGGHPAAWLRERSPAEAASALGEAHADWRWRFHQGSDLLPWLLAWKRLDAEGGLEAQLLPGTAEGGDAPLSRLIRRLRIELPGSYGLRFSLPDPDEGSACKRWRMFLRWMVRPGWPDLGQWQRHQASELVIPLDTHVARVARFIGLSARATPDGKMAREVTEALRRVDPEDPLKYDFALSHLGILGDCPGIRTLPGCAPCPLVSVCRAGRK